MMKVKICGMKYKENIEEVALLEPDYMGFIFYDRSGRFAGDHFKKEMTDLSFLTMKKTGVFVNAEKQTILKAIDNYGLDRVQLHGNESPAFCKELSHEIAVIKAFGIHDLFNFDSVYAYEHSCELFVFDTATKYYGGSGLSYNWDLLSWYKGSTSYLLSGGIGPDDIDKIRKYKTLLEHTKCTGLDLNSKFEISPALKDTATLKEFLNKIKDEFKSGK